MANNIDIFDWYSLTGAVNKLKPAKSFILDTLFTNREQHFVRNIIFGKSEDTDKLARFVHPNENPKLVAQMSLNAKQFELPITREKKSWTAEDLAKTKPVGQVFVGGMNDIRSASNEKVFGELAGLKNRVIRLREWMACQAISTGAIDVSQDNIAFKLDYGFVAGTHLITLTGNDLWSSANSNPLTRIRTWKREMAKRGYGATMLILGSDAADAFVAHAKVQADQLRQGYVIGDINMTNPYTQFNNFIGRFAGVNVYEYLQQYTNSSNVATNMIAADRAILIGISNDMTPGTNPFRLHYGPIYRLDKSNNPVTILNEMYLDPITNEARTYMEWTLEQCSLPAIHDPDCVISGVVV